MNWWKCFQCPKTEIEDVTTLDFSCCSLTDVPPTVFNYERTLQYLHLDCNKIIELPRTLFQCEELRYLGLCDNEIETVPPLIEKLSNLENLLLNRNCLAYESIPSNIHRCQRLRILHLSSNSLTKVPGSITRLVCLRELYLNNCDLEFLPANFGRLSNLRILELRENHFNSLPKSLKRLSDLRRLDISSNMFKKFPEVIGTMVNLTELWLNDNFISDIPDCIGVLHKLTHFDVSCNRLENITLNIGFCTSITLLILSMNDLKELPYTIGDLSFLHTLKVDHNLLEALPQSIGKLDNLEELDVQFNNLKSFPSSIGMLRKLNSLVAAQNSVSHLPTEIGSCATLSVLSLHYNALMYLPEEIGHLQNLTTISLISNKLQYLPITILNLRKLKALWLSHNQSQPLITLQRETVENGQVILTCVFLPQVEMPLHLLPVNQTVIPTGRRINFTETGITNSPPGKLTRIPTPHPKAFVKYQQTLETTLRRNLEGISQNSSMDPIHVKEANVVPMMNTNKSNEISEAVYVQGNELNESSYKSSSKLSNIKVHTCYDELQDYKPNDEIYNNMKDISNDCIVSVCTEYSCSPSQTSIENLRIDDYCSRIVYNYSADVSNKQFESQLLNGAKPKQPPPYHIAAIYSRGAHLFLNYSSKRNEESEPKHFTQDKPENILNPQPKHAYCISQLKYNTNDSDDNEVVATTNADNLILIEKVLAITSQLLKTNVNDVEHKYLTKQFLELGNVAADFYSILDSKLHILKAAEFLLFYRQHAQLHKNHILLMLDNIHKNLDILLENAAIPFEYFNMLDSESRDKLILIDIVILLLDSNYKNKDYYDLINQIINFGKTLPCKHLVEYIRPKTENEVMIQAKLQLLKLVMYFLSISSNNKGYKYIFGKLMELHKHLQCTLLKFVHNYQYMIDTSDQFDDDPVCLDLNNEIMNETSVKISKGNINWVFGIHRNPKIIKVELTPCCYVLGFSVNYSEEGIFISEVDRDGNAFQKLFTGDKILMLDDRDISKMEPEEALKAVQVWGPETETFLISRN